MEASKMQTLTSPSDDPAKQYRLGYLLGYRAGYRDAVQDKENAFDIDFSSDECWNDPIESMTLSTRAYNCLRNMGCRSIFDVAHRSTAEIRRARGVGKMTIAEIAHALQEYGLTGTGWDLTHPKNP